MVRSPFQRRRPIPLLLRHLLRRPLISRNRWAGCPARRNPKAPENAAYYGVPFQTKLEYGTLYLALAALLAIMTYDVHEMLDGFRHPA